MGANSKIEWTWQRVNIAGLTPSQVQLAFDIGAQSVDDGAALLVPGYTFNPWIGCTKVSPGCANCYAAQQDAFRKWTPGGWGKGKPRKRTRPGNWAKVKGWNAIAGALGVRQRVFCASLADWLDDEVDIAWLADLLHLIRQTPNLDWLLLTKRPENWLGRMRAVISYWAVHGGGDTADWLAAWIDRTPPPNVWLGTTVEDQERADERIPMLIKIPARVRFLSCEPLLGPVEFSDVTRRSDAVAQLGKKALDGIHWVIVGGESGPGSRPMHPDWARRIRDQCAAVGVPMLFKQWGDWLPVCHLHWVTHGPRLEKCDAVYLPTQDKSPIGFVMGSRLRRIGKVAAGRLLYGVEHNGAPVIGGVS